MLRKKIKTRIKPLATSIDTIPCMPRSDSYFKLIAATIHNDEQKLRSYIRNGEDVNSTYSGNSALYFAIYEPVNFNNSSLVKMLLENGATLQINNRIFSPLEEWNHLALYFFNQNQLDKNVLDCLNILHQRYRNMPHVVEVIKYMVDIEKTLFFIGNISKDLENMTSIPKTLIQYILFPYIQDELNDIRYPNLYQKNICFFAYHFNPTKTELADKKLDELCRVQGQQMS